MSFADEIDHEEIEWQRREAEREAREEQLAAEELEPIGVREPAIFVDESDAGLPDWMVA